MPTEWTAYSQKDDRFKLVKAKTQKQAIKKAVNRYNIIPQTTDDVRPRTGTQTIMTQKEFKKFMRD